MEALLTTVLLIAVILLPILITFLSLIEVSSLRLSRAALRVLAEDRGRDTPLLSEVARDRNLFLLPLQFTILASVVGLVIVIWSLVGTLFPSRPLLWTLLITLILVAPTRQLVPRFLSDRDPEGLLLRLLPMSKGLYRLLSILNAPLLFLLKVGQRAWSGGPRADSTEEPSEAEIQAYLDVGEEDGIFEEPETALIQSALEFGSTLVREIMTPRNEIVAIPDTATIEELKDLIVDMKFSRIPVYHGTLEQIVGIAYVRTLLAFLDEDNKGKPITPLLKKPWFIPETKKVSHLLKEMQKNSEPMALVVNEYGSISGLVTIEDALEEIVGEIYDEDESQTVDLRHESDGSYVVSGSMDVEDLEETLHVDLGETAVTTMSGLVVDFLGEVPGPGRHLEIGSLSIEILKADRVKIHSMRIRRSREIALERAEHGADSAAAGKKL